jgi:hypothetical protein
MRERRRASISEESSSHRLVSKRQRCTNQSRILDLNLWITINIQATHETTNRSFESSWRGGEFEYRQQHLVGELEREEKRSQRRRNSEKEQGREGRDRPAAYGRGTND